MQINNTEPTFYFHPIKHWSKLSVSHAGYVRLVLYASALCLQSSSTKLDPDGPQGLNSGPETSVPPSKHEIPGDGLLASLESHAVQPKLSQNISLCVWM